MRVSLILYYAMTMIVLTACGTQKVDAGLRLNDGEKWVVNAEMKPHIEKGHELLNDFIERGGTEYKELAEGLRMQNLALIESCTMKGESHEELHKWLITHMGLIEQLSTSMDNDQSEELIADLEESFNTYHKFFK